VQFVIDPEQVKQGDEHPKHVEFIKNLVVSEHDRHVVEVVQVPQGERHGIHLLRVESG